MTTKLFPILSQYISKNDTVIVGVSGGPDSVALLDLLIDFYAMSPHIVVAHVNHGIRGKAADKDEKFVSALAKSYGLKFEIKRVKLVGKSNVEELGRGVRRSFFEELRKKYSAKFIITAHTKNDQSETIILNFIRGSGVSGLAGMEIVNGAYLKPLLGVEKSEILAYLKSKKIKFCKDATNEDTALRRNFVRKKIIPVLEELNPSLKNTLTRNAEIFREINVWLGMEAEKFLKSQREHMRSENELFLSKSFLKLPKALQQEVVQFAFKKGSSQSYGLSAIKIGEILNLIERNVGKKKILLGNLGRGGYFYLDKGVVGLKID
jgi:tRNA(Ile)-lysidine synthase